jgi:cysteine synthase A
MKDRMALAGWRRGGGRPSPGPAASSSNTREAAPASPFRSSAVKGYPLSIVTSDAFAREKLAHMRALGATLEVAERRGRHDGEADARHGRGRAGDRARPGSFWTDQLNNTDQLAAYRAMGEEIWEQTDRRVDGFVRASGRRPRSGDRGGALRRRDPIPDRRGRAGGVAGPLGRPAGRDRIDGVGAGSSCRRSGGRASPTGSNGSRRRRPTRWDAARPRRGPLRPGPRPAET